ncbi:MAG: symmetrical bis(5'-nucleosyl)-tetraphosphatase [Burkholderiales bacterium]
MATYAIGDVQGCFVELQRLVMQLRFDATRDELIFVGDLVNRGPGSLEVLHFVRALGERAHVVLGNHDLHLLTVAEGFSKSRPDDTLGPILASHDRVELLAWLRSRPLMIVRGDLAVVHAGLLPGWSVDRAHALAREVELVLTGPDYRPFLAKLYGSKPERWSDSLTGADRLRVVVNAMTRMRFCSADGAMEFQTKGETSRAPPGYMPWFDVPTRASRTHRIVFGHWSALGLHLTDRVLGLDTGCVWGGALTAVRLEDRQIFQVGSTVRPG